MIALKLTDEMNSELEVSLEPSLDDNEKSMIQIMLTGDNNEEQKLRSNFYYIEDKEQLNALISKLISCKKQLQ
jgi:hypothetical protein